MIGDPRAVAAVAIAAVLIIAAIAALYITAVAYERSRELSGWDDDDTDPDGSLFVAELHHELAAQWDTSPAALATLRDALHHWEPGGTEPSADRRPASMLQPFTFNPEGAADPADTTPLPVAVCELGMPTEAYIDQLFAKYQEMRA